MNEVWDEILGVLFACFVLGVCVAAFLLPVLTVFKLVFG